MVLPVFFIVFLNNVDFALSFIHPFIRSNIKNKRGLFAFADCG